MIMSVMRENAPAFVASPRVVVLFALRCHPARPTYANAKIINIQIVKYTHLRSVRCRNRVLCVYNRRYNFSPKKENFGEQKNNRKSSREIKTNKTQFRERRMKGERGKKRKLFTEKSSLFLQVPIFCDDDNCPHPIPPSLLPLRPPPDPNFCGEGGFEGTQCCQLISPTPPAAGLLPPSAPYQCRRPSFSQACNPMQQCRSLSQATGSGHSMAAWSVSIPPLHSLSLAPLVGNMKR